MEFGKSGQWIHQISFDRWLLYIGHEIVEKANDVSSLVSAISALCGPKDAVLAAGILIGIAALKVIDNGNGIMITQIPPGVGPCIPTPHNKI